MARIAGILSLARMILLESRNSVRSVRENGGGKFFHLSQLKEKRPSWRETLIFDHHGSEPAAPMNDATGPIVVKALQLHRLQRAECQSELGSVLTIDISGGFGDSWPHAATAES